jgi:hypothetical protein
LKNKVKLYSHSTSNTETTSNLRTPGFFTFKPLKVLERASIWPSCGLSGKPSSFAKIGYSKIHALFDIPV